MGLNSKNRNEILKITEIDRSYLSLQQLKQVLNVNLSKFARKIREIKLSITYFVRILAFWNHRAMQS